MEINVTVEYRRVRRVRLEYRAQGLLVVLPSKFNGSVEELLRKHRNWINSRAQILQRSQSLVKGKYLSSRTDQLLRILILANVQKSGEELGAYPSQIKYRKMKTRWGTCSNHGVITFSTRLKYLPDHLVEFVVYHEMAHLKVMKHNKQFWNLMAKAFPSYLTLRQELQLYGLALENQ